VLHRGVAADRDLGDVARLRAGGGREIERERVDDGGRAEPQLFGGGRILDRT